MLDTEAATETYPTFPEHHRGRDGIVLQVIVQEISAHGLIAGIDVSVLQLEGEIPCFVAQGSVDSAIELAAVADRSEGVELLHSFFEGRIGYFGRVDIIGIKAERAIAFESEFFMKESELHSISCYGIFCGRNTGRIGEAFGHGQAASA